jgi:glutaredoxin
MTDAIIWTKPYCPYCDRAKALLTQQGITYEARDITQGWSMEQLLTEMPSARTMPQIWLDGKYIAGGTAGQLTYVGGHDELVRSLNNI